MDPTPPNWRIERLYRRGKIESIEGSFIPRPWMATLFCPSCSNLLVISSETGFNKWACNTCPYEFPITKQMTSRTRLDRKQVDDVLGGEEMWKHADSTAGEPSGLVPCSYCASLRDSPRFGLAHDLLIHTSSHL